MATFQDSDLLLVGRGGGSFRATAQDIKTYIESGDTLAYRGTADFTAAPVLDPDPPVVGDMYINTTAGTVDAGWTGAGGSDTLVGDRIFFDGSNWGLITSGAQDVGVTDVNVTAPITKGGTAAEPNIGISDATNSAKGAVQLADDAYDIDGLIDTTNTATDVLTGTHFDVLAGRITTAAGGGIQTVVGTDPIEASTNGGGDTATISIKDGTTSQKGAVSLNNAVSTAQNVAATPKAINDYAVPLDLSTLTELA